MPRLRPLSEAECYARLYGDRDSTVAVIHEGPSQPVRASGGLLGEELRRMFEERIDAREEQVTEAEAA